MFKERILTFLTKYKVLVLAILVAMIILESAFSKEQKDNNDNLLDESNENIEKKEK